MANLCIVCGNSGSGKSTSIETLDPQETLVINVLKKRLPFKASKQKYNSELRNYSEQDTYDKIINLLNWVSENDQTHKNIVIDDAIYIMRNELFARSNEKGYDMYKQLAHHFQQILVTAGNMRQDINIFLMLHIEPVMNGNNIESFKLATVGKMIDDKYNPIECVPVCLFSFVKFDKEDKAEYGFFTHHCVYDGKTIPAKSPRGMFEKDFIPNDLQAVVNAMNEYYN